MGTQELITHGISFLAGAIAAMSRRPEPHPDTVELHRIQAFARAQSMALDADEETPDGDHWNDLAAQCGAFEKDD